MTSFWGERCLCNEFWVQSNKITTHHSDSCLWGRNAVCIPWETQKAAEHQRSSTGAYSTGFELMMNSMTILA